MLNNLKLKLKEYKEKIDHYANKYNLITRDQVSHDNYINAVRKISNEIAIGYDKLSEPDKQELLRLAL